MPCCIRDSTHSSYGATLFQYCSISQAGTPTSLAGAHSMAWPLSHALALLHWR